MLRSLMMIAVLLVAPLGGCALFAPPPLRAGMTESEVSEMLGRQTARYDMGQGVVRLEYAKGPMGRETFMVDMDGSGRSIAWQQVLNESHFLEFQQRGPGMPRAELLRTLGSPGQRRAGGWMGGEVWSWRYPTNDCLWFQVTLGNDGRVRDGGYNIDPACDFRDPTR